LRKKGVDRNNSARGDFLLKVKGTTTESIEALRATQRKDQWQPTKSEDTSRLICAQYAMCTEISD